MGRDAKGKKPGRTIARIFFPLVGRRTKAGKFVSYCKLAVFASGDGPGIKAVSSSRYRNVYFVGGDALIGPPEYVDEAEHLALGPRPATARAHRGLGEPGYWDAEKKGKRREKGPFFSSSPRHEAWPIALLRTREQQNAPGAVLFCRHHLR